MLFVKVRNFAVFFLLWPSKEIYVRKLSHSQNAMLARDSWHSSPLLPRQRRWVSHSYFRTVLVLTPICNCTSRVTFIFQDGRAQRCSCAFIVVGVNQQVTCVPGNPKVWPLIVGYVLSWLGRVQTTCQTAFVKPEFYNRGGPNNLKGHFISNSSCAKSPAHISWNSAAWTTSHCTFDID